MTELTDQSRRALREQFIVDVTMIEHALRRWSPQPCEQVNGALRLVTGLLTAALEGEEFIAALYRLAHHAPAETN